MTVAEVPDGPPRHDIPTGGHSAFTLVRADAAEPGMAQRGSDVHDERQVHYLWWGPRDAPPVVCLHGGGQTAYMYEEPGAALRDRWYVIAPDLPAHGDSDMDLAMASTTGGLDRGALASSMRAFLDHLGIEGAMFVGASLGGITSLTIAAQAPERVAGIALIDIGHRLEDDGVRRIVEFMTKHESFASLDEAAVAIAEYLPGRRPQSPARLTRNLRQRADGRWEWKHALGRNLRAVSQAQPDYEPGNWRALTAGMEDEMRALDCPVLVLRGQRSDVLSDEGAREIAALIPGARLATIAAAGHLAAGDNPESTMSLVRGFLEELAW